MVNDRTSLQVDGHTIAITHATKILYPSTGTTKADIIDYYSRVAAVLLPHILGRPVTRRRWPNGVDAPEFFEKQLPASAPQWLDTLTLTHNERAIDYPLISSRAGLVWLAQQGALELHVPQWKIASETLTSPKFSKREFSAGEQKVTRIVMDLDPGEGVGLTECVTLALLLKEKFQAMGMLAYPVTSGSKGLHIYAAFPTPVTASGARAVAKELADQTISALPKFATASNSKAGRVGKVFIDWSQNSSTKTTIAPYSLRGSQLPNVAAPRTWDELADSALRQLRFDEVCKRVETSGDFLAHLTNPQESQGKKAAVIDFNSYQRKSVATSIPPVTVNAPQMLSKLSPMLPTDQPVIQLGEHDWAFEGKWDGYRLLIKYTDGNLTFLSRTGQDLTADFPQLHSIATNLGNLNVILDGEVVVYNESGVTSFDELSARRVNQTPVTLILFDLLEVHNQSVIDQPWKTRRILLTELAPLFDGNPIIKISELLPGSGAEAIAHSQHMGWEGVIAKRRNSSYVMGRSTSWLKQKNWLTTEAVIGGWRYGKDSLENQLGSMLLGVPAVTGLRYIGRVGSGITETERQSLQAELETLPLARSPFVGALSKPATAGALWVLPKIVVEVQFLNWTSTGHIRHPTWRGIRRDKLPGDI